MKKRLLFLLFFASCATSSGMMTMQAFYDIPVGATPAQIVQSAGEPYSVDKQEDGTVEYLYIERLKVGYRDLQERRYYLILKDGTVVSKRMEQTSPLPYGFDSYDMQTTQNDDP